MKVPRISLLLVVVILSGIAAFVGLSRINPDNPDRAPVGLLAPVDPEIEARTAELRRKVEQ